MVQGSVDRISFENDTTGFRILRLTVDQTGDIISVIGCMQRLVVGTRVRVGGAWEDDPRHGRQFRAKTVLVLAHDTREGLEKFLGSGLVPGIGPVFARRIVDCFGDDTVRILDREPHRLAEVPGLGSRRALAIEQAWVEQGVLREVMVFLQGHGVSAALAMRVYRRYGVDAIRAVSEDPYRLAVDVWGIGFQKADQIARTMGVAKDAPIRLKAAVLYALHQAEDRGHVFLPVHDLVNATAKVAGTPEDDIPEASIHKAIEDACCAEARREELYDVGPAVYRSIKFIEEAGLARHLARLACTKVPPLELADDAITKFERDAGVVLADEQRRAVHEAARASVLVITGGPGVGKTTIVRAILELYEASGLTVRLAAPTGRASRRMAETTGRGAYTLHRLLDVDPRKGTFGRNESNPIDAGAVVVDESSMLDQSIAFALVRAIPDGARLLFVGDADQLPSIGAGSVLRDMIDAGVVPVVRLNRIYRQAAMSRIVSNAHRIRDGQLPIPPDRGDLTSDFYIVSASDAQQAADRVVLLVSERIPRQFGFDPVRDVQVLAPMRRGPVGADVLNERLQATLNPLKLLGQSSARGMRVGDKVMQLKNDYERDVFNGDLGVVVEVDQSGERLVVSMDGRELVYDRSQMDELSLSYACSIHKSQGSEYPAVVVPLVASHFVMLSRNLLYTAVTRGKRLVTLVAEPRAISMALSEVRKEERYSYLFVRFREAVERCGGVVGE